MLTAKTTVYKFDELDEKVREKVLNNFLESQFEYAWWDNVYEMFVEDCRELGIEIDKARGRNGYAIYFDNYPWSAVFSGSVDFEKVTATLGLTKRERRAARCVIEEHATYAGIIAHDRSGSIELDDMDCVDSERYPKLAEAWGRVADMIEDVVKSKQDDLLKSLREEEEYLSSEEAIREMIDANEYLFFKDGSIANNYIEKEEMNVRD